MWREILYATGGDNTVIYLFFGLLVVFVWFGLWSRYFYK